MSLPTSPTQATPPSESTAAKPPTTQVEVEIFRAGTHRTDAGQTVSFSVADLDQIVSSYDPAQHEAPVVIGHPKANAPAYGWAKTLRRDGEVLKAGVDLTDNFAEAVKAGHYKKISSSLYPPGSADNPKPGSWSLRHVGFLGAQPPAIKGLANVAFAEHADVTITCDFAESAAVTALSSLRAWIVKQYDDATAEEALPQALLDAAIAESATTPSATPAVMNHSEGTAPPATPAAPPAATAAPWAVGQPVLARGAVGKVHEVRGEFASILFPNSTEPVRWFAFDELAAPPAGGATPAADASTAPVSLAEREALRRGWATLRRAQHADFCERLVRSGRPLPAPREDIVSLLTVLDSAPASHVSFSEATPTPGDVLRAMLGRMSAQIDFSEVSSAGTSGTANVADDAVALAKAADDYRAARAKEGVVVDSWQAVQAVSKGR